VAQKCLAWVKGDLEFCLRGVGRRRWRRIVLLVCCSSIESRPPDQVMVASVPSHGPPPGAEPPAGWHFVPNGAQGCIDKYGCARPSFDSDFWKWVSTGKEGCADEHGCARPRLPGKGDTMPPRQAEEKPGGPEKKGEKPEAQSESGTGPQPGGGPLPAEHELPLNPK
jgi:hypothetical protein